MEELTIRIELRVTADTSMADKIRKSGTGFLCINGEPLGSEDLTFSVINEEPIKPSNMAIQVL